MTEEMPTADLPDSPVSTPSPDSSPSPDPQPKKKPTRDDRLRRQLIGPFTVAQVGAVVAALVLTLVALVVLTSPLTVPPPTAPQPGTSPFVVGSPQPGLRVGDLAPEFEGTTVTGETVSLTDLDGNPIRLADLRGRPVWINFWASWCPPCQAETPILREMYDKYKDQGLALVGISVQETTPDDVRQYVQTYGLDYTVGFDATSAIFHAYRAYVLPTQIFVDRDGLVHKVQLGGVTRAQAEATIQELLAGGAPASPAASPAPSPAASPTPGPA